MFQICFKYFKETCSSGCKFDSTATFKHAKWFKCASHALQQSAQIAVSMLQMLQNNFKLYANILQMTATIFKCFSSLMQALQNLHFQWFSAQ